MRQTRRWAATSIAIVTAAALAASGCGKSESSNSTTTTAKDSASTTASASDLSKVTATLNAGGASFPDAYYQAVNKDFSDKVKAAGGTGAVNYAKSGSSDGRKQLAAGTLDFAGSDSLPKPEETFNGKKVLFFPTVAAPITVSYNLSGVSKLQLSAETIAKIFQVQITKWNDPAIAAENPGVTLPDTPIVVVHRSDGSGTTSNFTRYLKAASGGVWTLDAGDTVNWPATTQGAEKNSGVAGLIAQTNGAVGYVDLADAVKAKLSFASIKNADGNYVAPTAEGVKAALDGAETKDDLTYNPLNAKGPKTYPITAPTWLLVYAEQPDSAKAETLRAYLRFVLGDGQKEAEKLAYVGLPDALLKKAIAQIDSIKG